MQVPLLDLKPQYRALKSDIDAAIERVCESQYFILGPAVRELERAVAGYCQSDHGIGVSSGTDALLLALMGLDIGRDAAASSAAPADEVITASYTFFATGGTIARAGARPVFLDIDPVTFNLSPRAVETFIAEQCEQRAEGLFNRRTGGHVKGIMPVHLYGQLADMAALVPIARRHGMKVIEDAAQSIGAEDGSGRRACSFGDVGCLSFFPTKNLGAFGDAGMCAVSDGTLAERLEVLRVHGGKPKYHHALIGGNFRLDELQAAVLNIKLRHLDEWTAARQQNARFYDDALEAAGVQEHVETPRGAPAGHRHVYNQYTLRVQQRDELREHLAAAGIGVEIYYPIPLHLQECFRYLGYKPGDLPESERAALTTLSLPIYPELSQAQLQFVVDEIARFYRDARP